MNLKAAAQSDYEYIEWKGCRSFGRVATRPEPPDLDLTRVWLTSHYALRYWTRELGATIYEIRDAIAATEGRCATAVRRYLERNRQDPQPHPEGAAAAE